MGGRPWHSADPREARASAPRNSSLSSDHPLPSTPKGPLPPKARGRIAQLQAVGLNFENLFRCPLSSALPELIGYAKA